MTHHLPIKVDDLLLKNLDFPRFQRMKHSVCPSLVTSPVHETAISAVLVVFAKFYYSKRNQTREKFSIRRKPSLSVRQRGHWIYIYTLYVCIYIYLFNFVYIQYVCMYVCMYVCTYVRMHVCMYVCMYACIFVSMYICMCMHVYAYVYV